MAQHFDDFVNSTCLIKNLNIGPNGAIRLTKLNTPHKTYVFALSVWCFHFQLTEHIELPLKIDSILLNKMRCNSGYLLSLVTEQGVLKLNLNDKPALSEAVSEYTAALSFSCLHSVKRYAKNREPIDILIDWLIESAEQTQTPLPRLPAIEVLTDSIQNMLTHSPNLLGVTSTKYRTLNTLLEEFMNYDISQTSFVIALKKYR